MADRKYYVICELGCKFESMTKEQILTAIAQAVSEGRIRDIDTGFVTTIKTINGKALKFFVGTQSEYEALTDEEKSGLFAIITNDTSKEALENALAELQTNYDALTKNLADGSFVVAKATNAGYATSAGNASSATSATRATKDGSGNTISTTYAKKSDLPVEYKVAGELYFGGAGVLDMALPSGKSITDIYMVKIREVRDDYDNPVMVGFGLYPVIPSANETRYRMALASVGAESLDSMCLEFYMDSGSRPKMRRVWGTTYKYGGSQTAHGLTYDSLVIYFK